MMEMNVSTALDQIDAEEAALVAQVIALRGRKAEARERELGSAIERAQALITRYGITNDKLTFPAQPSIPMYRDPLSDETWSGKGNAPLWTRGKPLEQFLNPEWVVKKAKEEQVKAEREAKKAERAAKKAEKDAAKVQKCREQLTTTATTSPSVQREASSHNDAVNESANENDTVQHAGNAAFDVVAPVSNDAPTMTDGVERLISNDSAPIAVANVGVVDMAHVATNALPAPIVSNLN
ncbi:H-NS histone family protein [Burkholderia stagnalis]|uniref:H-NS histone family protein n=1 Tax=Burkholderia stagnalis TaxID=1503054 RepID=UPI000754E5CB|nr:H-NS histone family protein [Burkholderia stagnalis]KVN60310.1 hypothetical protein WT14_19340 [Burkholderia stagnalis]